MAYYFLAISQKSGVPKEIKVRQWDENYEIHEILRQPNKLILRVTNEFSKRIIIVNIIMEKKKPNLCLLGHRYN
jgi:hypothetical protein